MCNILSKKVINKLHKYKTVKMTVPTAKKMDRLPDSAWCGVVEEESLHFIEVQGTKQNIEWYSPGVGNWCVPTADLTPPRSAMHCRIGPSSILLGRALCSSAHGG